MEGLESMTSKLSESEIFEQYKKMVAKIANSVKYKTTAFDKKDLFQIGSMALIHAYRHFNPNKASFSTLAHICVKREIYRYVNNVSEKEMQLDNININTLEVLPDSLDENEQTMFKLLVEGNNIKETCTQMNIKQYEFKKIKISLFKKIKEANA